MKYLEYWTKEGLKPKEIEREENILKENNLMIDLRSDHSTDAYSKILINILKVLEGQDLTHLNCLLNQFMKVQLIFQNGNLLLINTSLQSPQD